MSRVEMVNDFATVGVVHVTGRSVFAEIVAFTAGALMVCIPTPPTTTPWTLSVPFTTSRRKSPVGNDETEFTYGPVPATAWTSVIEPPVSDGFDTVTVAPPTVAPAPSRTVTENVVSGAPFTVEAVMSPRPNRVLLPVPALFWGMGALVSP